MSANAPSLSSGTGPQRSAEPHRRALFVSTDAATLRAFLLPFAEHFRARGWRVDALAARATQTPECVAAFDAVWDVSWTRGFSGSADLDAVRRVRHVVDAGRYDIVHVHTPVAAALTRFALRHHRAEDGPRIVYTAHGFHFRDGSQPISRLPFRLVEQLAGRWTDHLVVINEADEQLARRHRLVPDDAIEHMPGIGIDTDHFDGSVVPRSTVEDVRRELGVPQAAPLLTLIAEFTPRKRHADAVRAVARLRTPDVHLLLVGGGTPERKQAVVDLATELGIPDRVHLVGRVRDVRPHILAGDLLLQVSDREGLPRSVMEAMSLGVPVVGTDTPGTRDLLHDGRGTLVPVGRPDVLAAAIDRVLSDEVDLDRGLAAARSYARDELDLRRILARHERTYERLLGVVAT